MVVFKLDNNLSCENICKKIQELLTRNNHLDLANCLLSINIIQISHTSDDLTPKIECKNG